MSNLLQSNGAQSAKPVRFAPIWTNRFFQGLWTQRSPLRDAGSTRLEEKFYGSRGDAMIDGLNIELTNRLTLARRPGVIAYNTTTISQQPLSFYSFRYYNGTSEQIKVIADTVGAVMDVTAATGVSSLYTKPTASAKSTFQSVGNTMFWGDGVAPKKLITSAPWAASTSYTLGQFVIDSYNNVWEVTAVTVTSNPAASSGLSGTTLTFPSSPTWGATVTDNQLTWTNYGSSIANWGSAAPLNAPTVGSANGDILWTANTAITTPFYLFDGNGNVQIALGLLENLNSSGAVVTASTSTTAVVTPNVSAGTTGNTYPNFNPNVGGTTVDGTVTWYNCGAAGSWQETSFYPSFAAIIDPVGNMQIASKATGSQAYINDITGYVSYPSGGEGGNTYYNFVVIAVMPDGAHTGPSQVITANASHFMLNWTPVPGASYYNVFCTLATQGSAGALSATIGLLTGNGTDSKEIVPPGNPNIAPTTTSLWMDDGAWYPYIGDGSTPSSHGFTSNTTQTVSGPTQESGTTIPTFSTTLGGTVFEQEAPSTPGITWMCYGSSSQCVYVGYQWVYAYHCVDGHVTTASPAAQIGGVIGTQFAAKIGGWGSADPQVDSIWLFRTADGGATFLQCGQYDQNDNWVPAVIANPGSGATWSYTDTTTDADLDIFTQAAIADANDPPPTGTIAPEYHLGRLFVADGNTVYYSQAYTSVGIAVQSFPPLNYFQFPSTVTRMVSTTSGLWVFTISDVYVIQGTTSLFATQVISGLGLLSYFALDLNGSTILMLSADSQFIALDPGAGVTELGFPIGDVLSSPFVISTYSTTVTFNPSNAYVSWHVDGSIDKAMYVSDGETGWFRCNPNMVPDGGASWSTYALISSGQCSAVQSIEIAPGKHRLLIGAKSGGNWTIAARSSKSDTGGLVYTDLSTSYEAYGVIGSIVLCQPGQLAEIPFITIDAVGPSMGQSGGAIAPTLGIITDEALPYYTGSFTTLSNVVNDPPKLPASQSIWAKRAYLNQSGEPGWCRHMQIKVDFGSDSHSQELLSITIFGAMYQEK